VEPGALLGKRCVVTGATSGIGLAVARALAGLGAEVVIVGRNAGRADSAAAAAAAEARVAGGPSPRVELADLSLMAEVRELADRLKHEDEPIDALVNCAGVYTSRRELTGEGLELQFAVNHLAAFYLTTSLFPAMAGDCRIATVSSGSHYYGWIRWRNPSLKGFYVGLWAYEQSKLANVLFSYELARRCGWGELVPGRERPAKGGGAGRTISEDDSAAVPTVFAVDPGLVDTDMGEKHSGVLSRLFWSARRRGGTSPDIPARGIARLVASPEMAGRTGLYWRDAVPLRSSRLSYDRRAADRLWELSELMVAQALARADADHHGEGLEETDRRKA
jgi:retinol dehydrogenase-14